MIDVVNAQKVTTVAGLAEKLKPHTEGRKLSDMGDVVVEMPLILVCKLLIVAGGGKEPAGPKRLGRPPKPKPEPAPRPKNPKDAWEKTRLTKREHNKAIKLFEQGKTWQEVRDLLGIPRSSQSIHGVYRGWALRKLKEQPK